MKKRGALTQQELEVMKRHTVIGFELLEAAGVDDVAKNIALAHHEKFDGGGYPRGLRGEAIPIEARIVAVADVFDALTPERCYKQAFPLEKALGLLEDGAGRHFDPAIVAHFLGALDDVMVIQATYQG